MSGERRGAPASRLLARLDALRATLRVAGARLLAGLRRDAMRDRLDEELRLHRELLAADLAAAGSASTPERELGGGWIAYRDAYDDRLGFRWLDHAWQDARFGLRVLRKQPGFALVSILTLALGIGGSTAMFCLLHHIVLKPIAYPDPERLLVLWGVTVQGARAHTSMPDFRDLRAQNRSFAQLSAVTMRTLNVTAPGPPDVVRSAEVSDNFFETIAVAPMLGRWLGSADDSVTAPAVVIGHALWMARFGGAADIIGRTIELDATPRTIVGVMPAGFALPAEAQIWTPFGMKARSQLQRRADFLTLVGRLRPEVTFESARAEVQTLVQQLEQTYPDSNRGRGVELLRWQADLVREARGPLFLLFGAVSLLLVIACVNIALLMLARGAVRRQELVTRAALGASRRRVLTQLITESLLLSAGGALLGIGLAYAGLHAWLRWAAPETLPRLQEIRIDGTVLAFATLIALASTLLFSALPLRHVARLELATALRGRGPAAALRSMPWLVCAQALLATVLVVGAGLLVRSLDALMQVDPGYRAEGVLTARINLPGRDYSGPAVAQFHERLIERLRALPGVDDVALVTAPPAVGGNEQTFSIRSRPSTPDFDPVANLRGATEDYLRLSGITLRAGRAFTAKDDPRAPMVAYVNETLVRRYFDGRSPLDERIRIDSTWRTIVGVIADVRQEGLDVPAPAEIVVPMAQRRTVGPTVLLRTLTMPPSALAQPLRDVVRSLDPRLPIASVVTLDALRDITLQQPRFRTSLLTAFAVVALLLVSLGIYGMTSYAVSRRTPEFGLRMALGATTGSIGSLVLGAAGRLARAGAAAGLVLAALGARALGTLLFGIRPHDPLTFAAAPLVVLAVCVAAAFLPARRAARVDPIIALRAD